jgi:recombination associated protein RdgC
LPTTCCRAPSDPEQHLGLDRPGQWLAGDRHCSAAKAEDVIRLLLKAVDKFPMDTLRVAQSPVTAMTEWLLADEAPGGFTVDQDTELRATGEGKATVRYVRHTLEAADVRRHIESGKQCTRLALTWADRVSFVLTESLTVKRIAPLDVLKENRRQLAERRRALRHRHALMTGLASWRR